MYLSLLILKVTNVHLEVVGGPHLDREEVMVILLEFLDGGILSDEQLGEAFKVMDLALRKGVEPIEGCVFKLEGKIQHKMESFLVGIIIFS